MYSRSRSWILPVLLGIVALLLLCGGIYLVGSRVLANPSTPAATPVPVLPTPVLPVATPVSGGPSSYPLAGRRYRSPQGDVYSAVWTDDGRLWQDQLPEGSKRIAHTLDITLEEGQYAFDGVECGLFLDQTRNGKGASNPLTVGYGNDLKFEVKTSDHGQAWALVSCRGNFSSGFQIRWIGPTR